MKRVGLIICMLIISISGNAQCSLNTIYAFCDDSTGTFYFDGNCSSVWLWSTGETTSIVHVPPGVYTVTETDTLTGFSETDTLQMWRDTWHVNWLPFGPTVCDSTGDSTKYLLQLTETINNVGQIFTHPSCLPSSFTLTLWQDSVPFDTISDILDQFGQAYSSFCVPGGHVYDVTIHDPVCNCSFGTWGTQSFYIPSILSASGVNEDNNSIIIATNPFNHELVLNYYSYKKRLTSVSIIEPSGRLIIHQETMDDVGNNSFRFNTSSWGNGIYLLIFNNGGNNQVKKVIKL